MDLLYRVKTLWAALRGNHYTWPAIDITLPGNMSWDDVEFLKTENKVFNSENPFDGFFIWRIINDYDSTITIEIDGTVYPLLDSNFPTVDPKDPYALSEAEQNVMERLVGAFENCDRLQQHMLLLLNKGSMYKVFNNNLLYHGCVLLDENGGHQAYMWLRPSGTESVLRVLVDVRGDRKALHDRLLSWQRSLIEAADRALD